MIAKRTFGWLATGLGVICAAILLLRGRDGAPTNNGIPVRIAAGVFLLSGIIAAVLATTRREKPEPLLNGIPLSHYLDRQTYGELRTERDARESIRDFGSNAVPYLVGVLDARESRFHILIRELAARQSLVRLRFTPLYVKQRQAALACAELGPMAAPASAALARLANDPQLCSHAISALAMIGPGSFPILTNALRTGIPAARIEAAGDLRYMKPPDQPVAVLLEALNDPEPDVRSNAAGSLAYLRRQLDQVVPALIQTLHDTNPAVRVNVAQSLGWLQHDAFAALPALAKLLETTTDPGDESKVSEAIRQIESRITAAGGRP